MCILWVEGVSDPLRSCFHCIIYLPIDDRVNPAQKEALLAFMERHTDFAKGRLNSPQAAKLNERLWARLKDLFNCMPGPSKSVKAWKDVSVMSLHI